MTDSSSLPPELEAAYQKPDSEWTADDWRALALYLWGELQSANHLAKKAIDDENALVARCRALMQEHQALEKKTRTYRKALRLFEKYLESGELKFQPRGRKGRPRKPPEPIKPGSIGLREIWELEHGRPFPQKRGPKPKYSSPSEILLLCFADKWEKESQAKTLTKAAACPTTCCA